MKAKIIRYWMMKVSGLYKQMESMWVSTRQKWSILKWTALLKNPTTQSAWSLVITISKMTEYYGFTSILINFMTFSQTVFSIFFKSYLFSNIFVTLDFFSRFNVMNQWHMQDVNTFHRENFSNKIDKTNFYIHDMVLLFVDVHYIASFFS